MNSPWNNLPEVNKKIQSMFDLENINGSKPLSKEGIRKVLQALETAGILERLKQYDPNLSIDETPRPIKDLTAVREFIETLEQAVATDNTKELTTDDLLRGIAKIKEALLNQIINSKITNDLTDD